MALSEKEKAARIAAAKYATEPHNAVAEYVILSKEIDRVPENYRQIPGESPFLAPLLFQEMQKKDPSIVKKMPDLALAGEVYTQAQSEMLSLIDQYRHPVNDVFAERMIFFC